VTDPNPARIKALFGWALHLLRAVDTIAVLTAVLAVVAFLQWQTMERTDHTLRLQQRAWLAPTHAELDWQYGPLQVGARLNTVVRYGNIGKEPATAFVAFQKAKTFSSPPDNQYQSWYTTFTPERIDGVCKQARSDNEGLVVYPSGPLDYDFGSSTDELAITHAVMEGTEILYIQGCFAYRTLEAEHKSQYCFMLVPKGGDPKQWKFIDCVRGNTAD
jgi:hypothetical protein